MENLGLPVPACHEMTEMEGRYGIVYEKIPGIDLYNYISQKRGYCLEEKEVIQIASQIIEALSLLHQDNIIYRYKNE